jgi:hypothetical protein
MEQIKDVLWFVFACVFPYTVALHRLYIFLKKNEKENEH